MIINTYLKPHLVEYLKFKHSLGEHIALPNYLLLVLLNSIRPNTQKTKLPEENNVSFIIQGKKCFKKNISYVLSSNARCEFQQEVAWCFWVEAEAFIKEAHRNGESMSSAYYSFLETYKIESLSYDAVKKHFTREKSKKNAIKYKTICPHDKKR